MNLQLPTRFLLLDRAIATLGSVGIELYPDFNVFEVARPYARGLMMERFTPERIARRARRDALRYAHVFREAPFQWYDFMEQVRDGQIEVGFVHKGLDDFLEQIQKVFNRLVIALIVAGGLIGSAMIGVFSTSGPTILGINAISVIGFALSTVLAVWLFWSIFRSGRL
jgi:ubiquinone biosynthesis protein